MTAFLTIALSFLVPIGLGYGVRRLRAVPAEGLAGIDFFVSYVALPVLFFRLVATTPPDSLPDWSFVLTTTFATYCAFAIAFSIGALASRGNIPEATIEGLAGSSANIGILAPGLVLAAFGSAAGAPMALVFTFDFALLAVLAPLMMLLGGTDRMPGRALALGIARDVYRQPLVIATVAGLVFALLRIRLPGALDGLLGTVAAAAAPAALFAFGLTIAGGAIAPIRVSAGVIAAVKLIVHPAIVYLLLGWIGGFDGTWVYAAILMAALPPAATIVTAARRYGSYVREAPALMLGATLAGAVTVLFILALLLDGALPFAPFD